MSKLEFDFESYSKIKDMSATVSQAISLKRDKLVAEVESDTVVLSSAMSHLAEITTNYGFVYNKRQTDGGLRFSEDFHPHGDVYWWDSNKNLIVFSFPSLTFCILTFSFLPILGTSLTTVSIL